MTKLLNCVIFNIESYKVKGGIELYSKLNRSLYVFFAGIVLIAIALDYEMIDGASLAIALLGVIALSAAYFIKL